MADWQRDRDDDLDRGFSRGEWDREVRREGFGTGGDRDEFAGMRGGGYLGGDYSRSGGRDFSGGGFGSTGLDYDRDFDRQPGRMPGASGNYLGAGGGYGSVRDDLPYDDDDRGGFAPRQSFRGRGPKGFQRSDERLRELISERLADHEAIDASEIEVTVQNSEVTLSGTVDDRRTRRLAEDVAESVRGVKNVFNHLKVDRGFFSRVADKVRDSLHRGGTS